MFEEVFKIIFDRRHVKDVRLWVLIILVISNACSFYFYNKYVVMPIREKTDRQGKRIRQIVKVGKFQAKMDDLSDEDHEHH